MAVIYLRSTDGSDASDGLTWAEAKATLAAALTAAGAGGTVYVADGHAQSAAGAMTLTSPGTFVAPVRVICVDDTGDPEPPTARATTATVSATGGSGSISLLGVAYVYGVSCTAASNVIVESAGSAWVFAQSVIDCSAEIRLDLTASLVLVDSSKLRFGSTSDFIRWRGGRLVVRGGAIADTGGVPTALFVTDGGQSWPDALLIGVDLSAFGSGKTLFDVDGAANNPGFARAVDCKLGASVTRSTTPNSIRSDIAFINADSADINYKFARYTYQATETDETTIVRTGGASDGTTTFSRKIVTTANVTAHFAYESHWMEIWNDTIDSAKTITVETVTDNVTLTDAEAWLEVEALTTDGDVGPLGVFADDRVSDPIFGTPANQTTSSETWTTTGLTTPVKQKLAVTITPREKGIIRARVCVAKASTTMYYDPKITIS